MANQIKIIKAKHSVSNSRLIIDLPKGAAEYLGLRNRTSPLYAVPVNGVIQLTNEHPTITIPVARVTEDDFVRQ